MISRVSESNTGSLKIVVDVGHLREFGKEKKRNIVMLYAFFPTRYPYPYATAGEGLRYYYNASYIASQTAYKEKTEPNCL